MQTRYDILFILKITKTIKDKFTKKGKFQSMSIKFVVSQPIRIVYFHGLIPQKKYIQYKNSCALRVWCLVHFYQFSTCSPLVTSYADMFSTCTSTPMMSNSTPPKDSFPSQVAPLIESKSGIQANFL